MPGEDIIIDESSNGNKIVIPIIDPQINVSSIGDTYVDEAGDTYAETENQTRITMPASLRRQLSMALSGHVSGGTGTFELYNATDGTSLGSKTTTSLVEETLGAVVSASDNNKGDEITIRLKNSDAGESVTIDGGGIVEAEYYGYHHIAGIKAMAISSNDCYISQMKVALLKVKSDGVLSSQPCYIVKDKQGNQFTTNFGSTFGNAEANSIVTIIPSAKFSKSYYSSSGDIGFNNTLSNTNDFYSLVCFEYSLTT